MATRPPTGQPPGDDDPRVYVRSGYRSRYLGRRIPGKKPGDPPRFEAFHHGEKQHLEVPVADLVGADVVQDHLLILAAADAAGCAPDEIRSFIAQNRLRLPSGRTCPDPSEISDVGTPPTAR